jgi:hypothetical protein
MCGFVTVCINGTLCVYVLLIGTLWVCSKRYTLIIVISWAGATFYEYRGLDGYLKGFGGFGVLWVEGLG